MALQKGFYCSKILIVDDVPVETSANDQPVTTTTDLDFEAPGFDSGKKIIFVFNADDSLRRMCTYLICNIKYLMFMYFQAEKR